MLIAKKKLLLPVYHFFEDDCYFGTLRASFLIPNAVLITREGNYRFFREKWFEGKYFCVFHHSYKVIAEKPDGTGYSFLIRHNSIDYLLKPGTLFDEKVRFDFELFHEGGLVGNIGKKPEQPSLSVNLNTDLPTIVQCFIFWLGYRAWICHRGWSYAPAVGRGIFRI